MSAADAPISDEERERRAREYIQELRSVIDSPLGWLVQSVFPTEGGDLPHPFAYTVGLSRIAGYELILVAAPPEVGHAILNSAGQKIEAGERPADRDVILTYPPPQAPDGDRPYQLALVEVVNEKAALYQPNAARAALGVDHVTLRQVVAQDDEYRWPWEPGYPPALADTYLGRP